MLPKSKNKWAYPDLTECQYINFKKQNLRNRAASMANILLRLTCKSTHMTRKCTDTEVIEISLQKGGSNKSTFILEKFICNINVLPWSGWLAKVPRSFILAVRFPLKNCFNFQTNAYGKLLKTICSICHSFHLRH